jgi:hypothetical protein
MLRRHGHQKLFAWALTLILGGALGNVIDRAIHGYVVDFIQVHCRRLVFPRFQRRRQRHHPWRHSADPGRTAPRASHLSPHGPAAQ